MLSLLLATATGLAAQTQPTVELQRLIPACVLKTNSLKQLLAGPDKPGDFPGWLAGMRTYRREMQSLVKDKGGSFSDPYAEPALQWAGRSFIQPQMMAHDRFFYDSGTGHYTVRRYLSDLTNRYGGIDSVLIWPTYPNIGVDNRNQFDLWQDMPGGLSGVRGMIADFHRQGVRVLIPIMNWDNGTRDEGVPMARCLAELARNIGADGFNGDTMSPVGREFYAESLRIGHPVALEPEVGLGDETEALAWNILSWGYWWPYQRLPAVDRYKFIEPRHLTHVCDRWAHDRTEMLQLAFFNGDGYESWENIWGIWNEMTPRDGEALRRIAAIYRAVPDLLVNADYEPFTPTVKAGVYSTKFPGRSATMWTVVNRADALVIGAQIKAPFFPGCRFFDLWSGTELKPQIANGEATLSFELEPRGYGAVLATAAPLRQPVKELLTTMRQRCHIKLGTLSTQWKEMPQRMVVTPGAVSPARAHGGMILVPAGRFAFETSGVMIEKNEGVDVQYPWEDKPSLKHKHQLSMKSFYIDQTPVTCGEFKRFLETSHYRPGDSHNFLRNWVNNSFPEGWARKPVTWVSLEDARAYAQWAGKRLPHEWEWQYAAQGTDGRLYPWGNSEDHRRVPPLEKGREQRPPADVDAYPQGASPFGVLDLVGNVWQWTDEFQDDHTRAAILKGGSNYRPDKSDWYFPQARQLNQHGKYLLLAPCIDRSATIGFRCVVDAM
jgi:formylglycine-generating enzyme required for sulfatase activity